MCYYFLPKKPLGLPGYINISREASSPLPRNNVRSCAAYIIPMCKKPRSPSPRDSVKGSGRPVYKSVRSLLGNQGGSRVVCTAFASYAAKARQTPLTPPWEPRRPRTLSHHGIRNTCSCATCTSHPYVRNYARSRPRARAARKSLRVPPFATTVLTKSAKCFAFCTFRVKPVSRIRDTQRLFSADLRYAPVRCDPQKPKKPGFWGSPKPPKSRFWRFWACCLQKYQKTAFFGTKFRILLVFSAKKLALNSKKRCCALFAQNRCESSRSTALALRAIFYAQKMRCNAYCTTFEKRLFQKSRIQK